MTAHRVSTGDMMDAARPRRGQLQDRRSQVGDVHGAADVIGKQDSLAPARYQVMDERLVHRTAIACDQRRPHDGRARVRAPIAVSAAALAAP